MKKNKPLSVVYEVRDEREYESPASARLLVEEGQKVKAGEQLTEGTRNPHRILRLLGRDFTQLYLLQDIQKVYRSQGVNINDKHFEVMIKKMLSKVQIITSGDSELLPGELVDRMILRDINERLHKEGKRPSTAAPVLFGVTKAALNTESFLSASSFQHTIKVLAGAAIEGKLDELRGLKENVIIGKLIPAGTGFKHEAMLTQSTVTMGEGAEMGIVAPSELMDD
jgi:DNA-directed RNA polymerase subunit beta'